MTTVKPNTQRWTAILASLLLLAAPALAQSQGGQDGDQQNDTATNDTSSGSDDGADYNGTDGNQTKDGSQSDGNQTRDGSQDNQTRDGNQSDRRDSGEPDENASEVGKDAREFARDAAENARRNVSVVVEGAQALVKMSDEDAPNKNTIGLDMAADKGRMDMSFDRDADDGEKPDFSLNVQLASLVEYEDLDGDGAYDPGEDRVLGTTKVDALNWSASAKQVALANNDTGQQVRAEAPLGGNGTVAVVVTAPGDFAEIGGTELTPRDVKVDYVIEDYPYESANASLALAVSVGGEDGYEVAQKAIGDTPAVQVTNGDATGYFGWKETARVDGEAVPVNASLPEQASDNATEAVQKVYLSYGHGDEIVHDPVMGVSYESASEDVAGAPGFGAAALVVAVVSAAALAGVARRRD